MSAQPDFALDVEWTDAATGVQFLAHARGFDPASFRANVGHVLAAFGLAYPGIAVDGLPANSGTEAQRPAPTPIRPADTGPACPEHHDARPSKFGGLYCPVQDDAGAFCGWTSGRPKRKAS